VGERPDTVETLGQGFDFLSGPTDELNSFVSSLSHFTSTLTSFATGTSLRLYKEKYFLKIIH
jgi:hypothetical protein